MGSSRKRLAAVASWVVFMMGMSGAAAQLSAIARVLVVHEA
jgi:hypothetical protein